MAFANEVPLPLGAVIWVRNLRGRAYRFREESTVLTKSAFVFGFAVLTGLGAQISIPLPFTPVPVTGQVLAVLLAGGLLGTWMGVASQSVYLGLGVLGVPWFAPQTGGPAFSNGGPGALLGVTGGYLVGFILAAAVVGVLLERTRVSSSFSGIFGSLLLGVAIIYSVGAIGFWLVLKTPFTSTMLYSTVPFLPGDILKMVLATSMIAVVGPLHLEGTPEKGPRWVAVGARSDQFIVAGALLGLWALIPLLTTSGLAPAGFLAYYILASGVATLAIVGALALRWKLGQLAARSARPGHGPTGPPSPPNLPG